MAVMSDEKLLSRNQFRHAVLGRDGGTCVFCEQPVQDAHHILERRLFSSPGEEGGYFLSNGASVCQKHHLDCEMTLISVDEVREACGIQKWTIPEHFYDDHVYDKWGNPIFENGTRGMGELFFDESVQKILKQGGVLDLFTKRVKYQRTFHMPWSEGIHDDDKALKNMSDFEGQEVVLTLKMDGENTTMYNDYIHARSIDGRSHPSRDWVKNFHSQIAWMIPDNFRVIGENVFAKHSIPYHGLPSFFLGFQVWENMTCLSYDDTLEYFELLGVSPVRELWRGIYDEKAIRAVQKALDLNKDEGTVLRVARAFEYGEFRRCVAKQVREGHVQTSKHWANSYITQNSMD